MIFLGDIAVPSEQFADSFYNSVNNTVFKDKDLIVNLEGLIMDDVSTDSNIPILFNHSSIIDRLKKLNCKAVTLANNHTLDRPEYFNSTIENLNNANIKFTGAGNSIEKANEPAVLYSEGKKILLFSQCWSIMINHQKNPTKNVYVATINTKILFNKIRKYQKLHSDAAIVVYFHWNFDLEVLPFPSDRKIARELIDMGVDLVLGCHSHCIQGAEKYLGKTIIYGLGNFYIPWYTYINGHISFPDFSKKELAVEWNPHTNEVLLHFFNYSPENNHSLKHYLTEDFNSEKIDEIKKHTPYMGFSEEKYRSFFKKNRRKKYLVPIYDNYNNNLVNKSKNIFLILRIRFLRKLAQLKLRSWNN